MPNLYGKYYFFFFFFFFSKANLDFILTIDFKLKINPSTSSMPPATHFLVNQAINLVMLLFVLEFFSFTFFAFLVLLFNKILFLYLVLFYCQQYFLFISPEFTYTFVRFKLFFTFRRLIKISYSLNKNKTKNK